MSIDCLLDTLISDYEDGGEIDDESITYRGITLVKDKYSGESIKGANTLYISLDSNYIVFSYGTFNEHEDDYGTVWSKTFSIKSIDLEFHSKEGIN